MKVNIPNFVTLLRISLIPIFVLVFYLPIKHHHVFSAIIFAAAALTDLLDGYLARKLQQVSPLGEFLDPVADKLIVAVSLVLLVQAYPSPWLAVPAVVIVSREIVISALREWMADLGKRKRVAVQGLAKFKTAAQMIAIFLLLAANPEINSWITNLGYVLIYIAAILTLWTMIIYLRIAAEELRG